MPRLPVPGGDVDGWGAVLNDYLGVEHNDDGSHKALPQLAAHDADALAHPALRATLPVNLGTYCTGDGIAEDATGFQAALDDLPAEGGRLTSPPGKKYRISTPLTCSGKNDVEIDLNGSYIESRIASGVVLTVTGCARARIISPRFRLMAGAPSAFLVVDTGSPWATIYEPVIWSNIDIPADCDGIVVQNDAYWVEVIRPQMRILSGTLTGEFRRGVSFTTGSNAGKALGGSVNHCTAGTYLDSVNACEVNGTAFEGCTDGVELAGTGDLGGTQIAHIRLETISRAGINITATLNAASPNYFPGITIGPIKNHMGGGEANLIRNPNGHRINRKTESTIELRSPWASFPARVVAQSSDNQSQPLVELEQRPASAPQTALTVEAAATDTTLTVDSTEAKNGYPAFPASGNLRIGEEVISYTAKTATTFTGCARGQGDTTAAIQPAGRIVRDALNQTFAVDSAGVLLHRSNSALLPTPVDDRVMLHHRAFITRLISWHPTNAGCQVALSVGDGAGGVRNIVHAFLGVVRPGVHDTIDVGTDTMRYRHVLAARQHVRSYQTIATDAAATLAVRTHGEVIRHTGTLTVDRTLTLSTSAAIAGMRFEITRTGGGAFNLDVGGLKSLATNEWCVVVYDGAAWYLSQFGSL